VRRLPPRGPRAGALGADARGAFGRVSHNWLG
jgi:hypothetical protein